MRTAVRRFQRWHPRRVRRKRIGLANVQRSSCDTGDVCGLRVSWRRARRLRRLPRDSPAARDAICPDEHSDLFGPHVQPLADLRFSYVVFAEDLDCELPLVVEQLELHDAREVRRLRGWPTVRRRCRTRATSSSCGREYPAAGAIGGRVSPIVTRRGPSRARPFRRP